MHNSVHVLHDVVEVRVVLRLVAIPAWEPIHDLLEEPRRCGEIRRARIENELGYARPLVLEFNELHVRPVMHSLKTGSRSSA